MSHSIVIADDHLPTRRGVRAALEDAGWEVCADVGSGPDAVTAVAEHAPEVALLDVDMPGGGVQAAAEITALTSDTTVVMFTAHDDDEQLFAAIQAGAQGYLLKDTDPDRLPHALSGVLNGEAAMPRALVARLMTEFRNRDRRRDRLASRAQGREALSEREREVLEALRKGESTKVTAERLGLSDVTIRRHVSAVLRKLGVSSREEAVDLLGS